MRVKIKSGRVYEVADTHELLKRLHETSSTLASEDYRAYLEGFVKRLRPMKIWLDAPASVSSGPDDKYAAWLSAEMFRVGAWEETDAPTEEEKAAKAAAAAEAKKAAAAAKAAAAKAAADAKPPPAST